MRAEEREMKRKDRKPTRQGENGGERKKRKESEIEGARVRRTLKKKTEGKRSARVYTSGNDETRTLRLHEQTKRLHALEERRDNWWRRGRERGRSRGIDRESQREVQEQRQGQHEQAKRWDNARVLKKYMET